MATPLERPLAQHQRTRRSLRVPLERAAAALAIVVVVLLLVSRIDFRHDLHRLRVRVLSGPKEGNYHAIVDRLAAVAAQRGGAIENIASAGSAENVTRLAAAAKGCSAQFALAQDGTAWPPGVELIGRFAKSESLLFLGKGADAVHDFADLRGLRIGAGVAGSGTDAVVRQLFALPEFASLGVTLENHGVEEALGMASRGDLDLAALVIDADAPLVDEWVGRRGLAIAGFENAHAVARRLPHRKTGVVGAGNYDAVRGIPKTARTVLRVEMVLVGNGCAGRVETMDLLAAVASELPTFVRHNKDTPNTTGLALAPAAADYFANDGPQVADLYLPWLVDVMPPANWAYVVMAVSILFNAMSLGHRFRLWRIDANRVRLEGELAHLFPPATTLGDIQRSTPDEMPSEARSVTLAAIDHLIHELEDLAARSRKYSLSMLVPMGQEMAYRYQESVMYETLAVLRDYRKRSAGKGV
jgi:TRAP-type uncharacterized transport system substrate-binding protein